MGRHVNVAAFQRDLLTRTCTKSFQISERADVTVLIVTPQLLLAGCDSGELVCIADNVGAGDSAAADVDAGDSAAGGYRSNDDGDSGDSNAGAFGGNTFLPYSSQL